MSFDPNDPQKIIDRYLAGESATDIARDFGYTHGSLVNVFLRTHGVQMRPVQEAANLAKRRKRSAASLYHAGT